jgi:3-oxoacyl-[acyl-carrier protein] reductase
MASAALDRWGRIDILASNAGVFPHFPILQFGADEWDRVVAVNARGALFAMQACLPSMIERRYGRIVLTSSITGPLVGVAGYGPYGATKAALLGLMRSVALEVVGDGITINAVMPGNIRTAGFDLLTPEGKKKMLASIPMGVVGEPEDVAWAVRYLASAEARYVTGQTIIIDGGQVLPEGELD